MQAGKKIWTYVWIDASGNTRSKVKVENTTVKSLLTMWNFDGSSTGQATAEFSEVILNPVRTYDNASEPHKIIVLCECLDSDLNPTKCNQRDDTVPDDHWFGFEQEYYIIGRSGKLLAWEDGTPAQQGEYYCSVNNPGNFLSEKHLTECLNYGIEITGTNCEVGPGQHEYQIFNKGVKAADDLIISRFLLQLAASRHELSVTFDPKPIKSRDWNGSGLHTNFSTGITRNPGGYKEILRIISNLEASHAEDIKLYGDGNEHRMTGECETSSIDRFTWGVADRTASVRIGTETKKAGYGYLEDRRPSANANPYDIVNVLYNSVL